MCDCECENWEIFLPFSLISQNIMIEEIYGCIWAARAWKGERIWIESVLAGLKKVKFHHWWRLSSFNNIYFPFFLLCILLMKLKKMYSEKQKIKNGILAWLLLQVVIWQPGWFTSIYTSLTLDASALLSLDLDFSFFHSVSFSPMVPFLAFFFFLFKQ